MKYAVYSDNGERWIWHAKMDTINIEIINDNPFGYTLRMHVYKGNSYRLDKI